MLSVVMRSGICAAFTVGLLCSCSTLTEDRDPTADCVTGTHWVGGDTGHEEMHPGRDCVGCHRSNDGPPLALGGTIYPLSGQVDDCYGEPGVQVLVKDANGEVFEFETNAAGNFYLEGDESQVAKPYNVRIRFADPAATAAAPTTPPAATAGVWETIPPGMKQIPMGGAAMTGDCGSCHKAVPAVDVAPVNIGAAYAHFQIARSSQQRSASEFVVAPAATAPATAP